jgi:prophage regulatory protein
MTVAANDNLPILISAKDAAALTSLSRPQINVLRGRDEFPRAVELGERRIAFVRAEVIEWVNTRIAARAQRAAA